MLENSINIILRERGEEGREEATGCACAPTGTRETHVGDLESNSQHLEYFHKAAEDTVSLSAEFDANATAGGADHQTVDQVGLAVVAHAGGHLLVGHVVAFHLHVDLIGRDND